MIQCNFFVYCRKWIKTSVMVWDSDPGMLINSDGSSEKFYSIKLWFLQLMRAPGLSVLSLSPWWEETSSMGRTITKGWWGIRFSYHISWPHCYDRMWKLTWISAWGQCLPLSREYDVSLLSLSKTSLSSLSVLHLCICVHTHTHNARTKARPACKVWVVSSHIHFSLPFCLFVESYFCFHNSLCLLTERHTSKEK